MLLMQLPLSEALRQEAAKGHFFGTDALEEGLQLVPDGLAELRLAYFPQAEIGWSGTAGSSEPVNVPHRLLTVRLPVTSEKHPRLYQTVFALTDDDVALLIYRMGGGIPAKLANISFATAGELPTGPVAVTRRGLDVLEVQGLRALGPAAAADVEAAAALLAATDVDFGTDAGNTVPSGEMAAYKKHTTKATVTDARRVALELSMKDGVFDGVAWMFEALAPAEAWWITADLEVTTSLVEAKRGQGAAKLSSAATRARSLGEVVTPQRITKSKAGLTYSYSDGDVVWFNMKINPEKLSPYLPPGVTLDGDEGLIWNVRWQPADPLNPYELLHPGGNMLDLTYNELWVCAPVTYRGRRSIFPVLMLLDEDVGQIAGQDQVGCPKKLGNLTYTFSANPPAAGAQVNLNVSRHGRPVIQLSANIVETADKTPIVGVNDNKDPAGSIMWMMSHQFPWDPAVDRPRYLWIRGAQRTQAQLGLEGLRVELGSGAPEPLGEWFQGAPLRGGYIRMDQDWGPSTGIPLEWNLKEQPDAEGYLEWWRRAFPVMYM